MSNKSKNNTIKNSSIKNNKSITKHKIIYYIIIFTIIVISIVLIKKILFSKFKNENFYTTDIINKKIYVICRSGEYRYLEDYILSFYKKLNAEIIVYNSINDIPTINKTDIFIILQFLTDEILQKISKDNDNIYLVNTEQLSHKSHKDRLNSYPKNIKMLDYSKTNLKYYDGYYNKFLSYQINFDEIYNLPKTKDICIALGSNGDIPVKRQIIIDSIKNKGYEVDFISGWKKERDEKLFTYKILLNISFQDGYTIFESIRCDRCIFNRMIIISDKKEDMESYYLKDYMIFEDYDKIADKTIEVLNNYDMYYKKLGLDTLDLNKLQVEPVSL